ncbi:MAG: hypothetical protein J6M06_00455 [Synergistaceae bacterium]|nr:hypothetical protein [Synergistaceae bacterium]
MPATQTLREIAIDKAKKRPELVDYLLEEAPILDKVKWIPASHGLWNVEEKLSDITGAQFVDLDAPLPAMDAKTKLVQNYVSVMGGTMTVGEDKAAQFGGAPAYFARRESKLLKKAGMDTEAALFSDWWRKAAIKGGLITKCGGTGSKLTTIVVCRMDADNNVGIYDPTGFAQGRLLEVKPINNAALYDIGGGVLGYGVRYKGRFGWQIIEPKRAVWALVNVDETHLPSVAQVEDAISAVRGNESNTMILGNSKILGKMVSAWKLDKIQYVIADNSLRTRFGDLNGVKICGSYNVSDYNETAVA